MEFMRVRAYYKITAKALPDSQVKLLAHVI